MAQGNYIGDAEIKAVATKRWFDKISDQDGDGVEDIGKMDRAVSSAESEFESCAKNNYDIGVLRSLNPTPPIVVDVCVDLCIHAGAAMDGGDMTKAIRRRYDDRMKWLTSLKNGTAKIPDYPDTAGGTNEARQASAPRLWTRDSTSRL